MSNEIKKDPFGLNEILDNMYEFDPRLYSLQEIDAVDIAISNVIDEFREIAEDEIKDIMRVYEGKLRETDTLHIFSIFSHKVLWSTLTYLEEKYGNECEKTRSKILEEMEYQSECNEASKHFEDYMNQPQESREPDPCEVPDFEGNYKCPFDSSCSDDCRRNCGVGVDE